MFKALQYIKILEDVGFSRSQAEAHVQMAVDLMETNLATKQDVKDLRTELRTELGAVRVDIENKIVQSEYRLTIKLGTIVSIAIGIAVTLAKLV